MTAPLDQRKASWCQPISSSSFGGGQARYEEKYEQLLLELGKIGSVHGEVCNWNVVYHCADELLRTKTKDMTVLGALCLALYHQEGFLGLAAGMEAYAELCEQHAQQIYPNPRRLRGRAGAYTWLTEQLIRELEQTETRKEQHPGYLATLEAFKRLDEAVRQQLGELHPRVNPIVRQLELLVSNTMPEPEPEISEEQEEQEEQEEKTAVTEAPQPPTAPAPEPAQAPAQAQAPAPAPPPAPAAAPPPPLVPELIENDQQAAEVLELLEKGLSRLSRYHLEHDGDSSFGYQLAHMAAFIGVLPDGDRGVRSPSPRRLRALQEAANSRRWDELLQALPAIINDNELDLEVEHYLSLALEQQGHRTAAQVVKSLAAAQLEVLGELARASAETSAWLQESTAAGQAAPEAGAAAAALDPLTELVAEAERTTKRQGLEQGCMLLQQELRRAVSSTSRFRLQLAMATLCLQEGAAELAQAILTSLRQELEQPVRSWDPDLLVAVVTPLLTALGQLIGSASEEKRAELRQEADGLMNILAQLDPPTALRERAKWQR